MRITPLIAIKLLSALIFMAIYAVGARAIANTMEFRIPEGPEAEFIRKAMDGGRYEIYAKGTIVSNTDALLLSFIAERKIEHARVHFDSPGGSLAGGIKLGKMIRNLGFETEVKSQQYEYGKGPKAVCASACAYAFAGGASRFYSDEVGRLGLHQFYGTSDASIGVSEAQIVSGEIVKYLNDMGIDGRAFVIAAGTSKEDMTWLSTASAEQLGIADNGAKPATAEIKLTDGRPYLKIEQEFNDVTSRVLLICEGSQLTLMGGIVTTPEKSREQSGYFPISLLEFDQTQYQPLSKSIGSRAVGSVIWVERRLDANGRRLLMESRNLGMWLHNDGAMRWGSFINISQVKPKIANFIENCTVR